VACLENSRRLLLLNPERADPGGCLWKTSKKKTDFELSVEFHQKHERKAQACVIIIKICAECYLQQSLRMDKHFGSALTYQGKPVKRLGWALFSSKGCGMKDCK
jgi:hypothetical protein